MNILSALASFAEACVPVVVSAASCTCAPMMCVPSEEDLPGVVVAPGGFVGDELPPVPVVPPVVPLPVVPEPGVPGPVVPVLPVPADGVVPEVAAPVSPPGVPVEVPDGEEVPPLADEPVEPEGAAPPPDIALPLPEGLGVEPGVVGLAAVPPVVPDVLPGAFAPVARLSSRPQAIKANVAATATTMRRGVMRVMESSLSRV
jgi:hypothetical protein